MKVNELDKLIEQSVVSLVKNKKVGLFLSSGIDSTLLAIKLKELNYDVKAFHLHLKEKRLKDAKEIELVKKTTKKIRIPLNEIKIDLNELEKGIKASQKIIKRNSSTQAGVNAIIYLILEKAKKLGLKEMVIGQGSDELFLGYKKFKGLKGKELIEKSKKEIRKLKLIEEQDAKKIGKAFNIEIKFPYLFPKLIEFALKLPIKEKLNEKENKIILRKLLKEKGLKEESKRKKIAMQYGSNIEKGIEKLMKAKALKTKKEYLKSLK